MKKWMWGCVIALLVTSVAPIHATPTPIAIALRSPNGTSNGSSAGTASLAVGLPSGIANGDVVLLLINKSNQSAIAPPGGYTIVGAQQSDSNVNSAATLLASVAAGRYDFAGLYLDGHGECLLGGRCLQRGQPFDSG